MKKTIAFSILFCLMLGYYTYVLRVLSAEIKLQTEWMKQLNGSREQVATSLQAVWDANEVIQDNTIRISVLVTINLILMIFLLVHAFRRKSTCQLSKG